MSTKTTFKRVALVAVASMGFGVLTSIAPASAVTNLDTKVKGVTVSSSTPARAGIEGSISASIKFTQAVVTGDTATVGARVTSAPTGSLFVGQDTGNTREFTLTESSASWDSISSNGEEYLDGSGAYASASYMDIEAAADVASASFSFKINFTPDKAGTYEFLVWAGGSTWKGSYKAATASVTTAGKPTAVTITKYGQVNTSDTTNGAILLVSLKDANGLATRLGVGEGLAISHSSTKTVLSQSGLDAESDLGELAASKGTYYVTVVNDTASAAGTDIVSFTGSGTLSATLSQNVSVSIVKTTSADLKLDLTDSTGYAADDTTGPAISYDVASAASHGVTATVGTWSGSTFTAGDAVTAATTYALTSSNLGLTYATGVTVAADKKTGTVTAPGVINSTYTAASVAATDNDGEVAFGYAASALSAVVLQGSVVITAAKLSSVTATAIVEDQYGNALANEGVVVSVSGRNTKSATLSSNSLGMVSYTYTDAGTASISDALVFTSVTDSTVTSDDLTITWGDVAVATVTVTGGSTADTVAGTTTFPISTGDGAEAGSIAFTATVKDANGNLLAGVPVTFTTDAGATGAIKVTKTVNYTTVYTGSTGTAVTYVFGWKAPQKITVTATAGGKSGTGYANFVNDDLDARVLSVTAVGNVATALVVDRFGNPVEGVTVDGSASNGYFGSGTTSTSGKTAANGTVGFVYAGSDNATLTFSIDKTVYTQSADAAGEVGATALTASVAGTTVGTGASLAPAGVNKVTVAVTPVDVAAANAQAATDAAAEATDAANAATDAANAAAEAADAATAAAQDAADAVAALSTQVSEMINALKKQITALTNLVIKIQKKVKA